VPGRDLATAFKVLVALVVLLLGASRAMAYVGPGADVTFINTAMTLLMWVGAMFSAVLLWPVYALLGWIRRRKNKSPSLEAAPEEARAVSPTDS
jgi:hypothetical protein